METNKFGENLGDVFGTICWLWVFHRFRQDGAVLLGYQHPWEHGHADDHQGGSHAPSKKLKPEEVAESWQKFSERSTIPGDDDDDDVSDGRNDDQNLDLLRNIRWSNVSLLLQWNRMTTMKMTNKSENKLMH
jgi:hypothetical protein